MIELNYGNTAFMLIATALVMIMTPGLALFYGGLVGRKNVLAIMIQSFISMSLTTIIWFVYGYSLSFSGDYFGLIGDLNMAFLRNIDLGGLHANGFPILIFIAYQMMFAVITPALITGAFANRIRFSAYLLFLTLWLTLVYFPVCHMAWSPNGLLVKLGVLDFAGGMVVHATAGFAALASVLFVGKREETAEAAHNVPLVALGTGLLWFGWYGFNAGSELAADRITALAFFNTDLAASVAAAVWLLLVWIFEKKPKFVGLLTGALAGLVAITPAAGFVTPGSAFIIGVVASVVCYFAVHLKNCIGLDDALDVWGVHGIGGVVGSICVGIFASNAVNPIVVGSLLSGDWFFFVKETISVVLVCAYAFAISWILLWLINKFTAVKFSQADSGLDWSIHGEIAYE